MATVEVRGKTREGDVATSTPLRVHEVLPERTRPGRSPASSSRVPRLLPLVRLLVTVVLLGVLVARFGAAAFRPALDVLAPWPIVAALVLGGAAIAAQSARWRVVVLGSGQPLGRRRALVECYRSSALNSVLPGGIAGDAWRAWRQRIDAPRGWVPSAVSVATERVAGLGVLLATAATVMLVEGHPAYAGCALVGAVVACLVIGRPMQRMTASDRARVWGWSAVALFGLVALTVVVGRTLDVPGGIAVLMTLGVVQLAGMSVPLSIGGWGPREAAGALAASLVGVAPSAGIAMAAGYGLLTMVAVLPGFVAMLIPTAAASRTR
jgi:glycosyltransferase 2 family protein